ncbi:cell division protein ZapA [Botryobacter ruber]|uniref:cell division protein ZapA n=1 Tax=Botryobacter ruber TaxID=2171629 RepID=UPI000E0C9BC9|nr:cell division protein ZapA [Botryobacter ruber]
MSELSIKIRIAEREYPMRVKEAEEERLRMVGKLLNERVRFFKEQFGIQDKQDLLAMVAFETMVDKLKMDEEKSTQLSQVSQKLHVLDELLSSAK